MIQRPVLAGIGAILCGIVAMAAALMLPLRAQQVVMLQQAPSGKQAARVTPAPLPAGEGADLMVLVVDASTGAPVSGVRIELDERQAPFPPEFSKQGATLPTRPPPAFYEARTATDGRANFSNILATQYSVLAEADGRVLVEGSQTSVKLVASKAGSEAATRAGTINDKPASLVLRMFAASRVSGIAMDREKIPVVNAQVELLQEAWVGGLRAMERAQKPVQTDAEGRFRFAGVLPGSYYIRVVPNGLVRGGAEFRIDDEDLTGLRVRLEPGMTFQGKVIDEDGNPIPMMPARVSTFAGQRYVYDRGFLVNPDGAFITSGIRQEHYILEFPDQPWVVRKIETQDRTFEGPHFDLTSTRGTAVVTVSTNGASIGGTVELLPLAKQYPRGMVTLTTDPRHPVDAVRRARLDGDNAFRFEHLPPGGYRVCAWLEEGSEINRVLGNPAYQAQIAGRCEHVEIDKDGSKSANLKQFSASDIR